MKLPKAAIAFAAILSSFSLASCNKPELINLAYGSLDNSLKEITYTDLATMVNDEDSFILAITSSSLGCGCWSTFKNQVLLPYQNENHVMIYYINHQEFYDASQKLLDTFGLTITIDPGFGLFNKGKLKYTEKYSSKNYVFSKQEYFVEYMQDKVKLPHVYYVSKDMLDELYKGTTAFNIMFSRSNCGDCKYVLKNALLEYAEGKDKNPNQSLYILECEDVYVKYGGTTVKLREYDSEGNLTTASQTRWQAFKDEYGLSSVNETYGFNTGVVPTFMHVEPNGSNKNVSVIKDAAVYFNDVVSLIDGKYIVTDSFYTEERQQSLSYISGVKTKVLKGLELNPNDVTSYGEYISWNHDAAEKYHTPLLNAFLDKYC
ncbi:MAG: hypothetical protein MJ248_04205 [Bacilli bacterium]|nr:hypothetical protein [Bacilli bacterium]